MVTYITSEAIIGLVIGKLSSLTIPKYPRSKPTVVKPAEYVVVNTLGLNANVMQTVRVNVNYHVKDMSTSYGLVPDMAKINTGAQAVIALLGKVTESNYLIDFEGEELIPEPDLSEHYSNIKFSFKYINK